MNMRNRLPKIIFIIALLIFLVISFLHVISSSSDNSGKLFMQDIRNGTLYDDDVYIDCVSFPYSPIYFFLWYYCGESETIGRLLTLVFTIACCVLLIWMSKSHLAPAMFLLCPIVFYWGSETRADIAALFFTLIGMWIFYTTKSLWCVPFFILSVYTKQSYIVAPLVVGLYLLIKDRKRLIYYALGLVIPSVAFFLLANSITDGGFYTHTIKFPLESTEGGLLLTRALVCSAIVLMVGVVPIVLGVTGLIKSKGKPLLLSLWIIVAALVMMATIGKPGSGTNYGLELVAACSIVGAMFVESKLNKEVIDVTTTT